MSRTTLIDLLYLVAATTFLIALKGLGSPKRARLGNVVALGKVLACGFCIEAEVGHKAPACLLPNGIER